MVNEDACERVAECYTSRMNRFMRIVIILSVLVVLASCTRQKEELPTEEVLSRSVIANHSIDHGAFVLSGTVTPKGQGIVGDPLSFGIHAAFSDSFHAGAASGSVRISSQNNTESVIHLDAVLLTGGDAFIRLTQHSGENIQFANGTWWKLSSGAMQMVSADSSLLSSQMDALKVTKNRGNERIGKREFYHFDVILKHDLNSAQQGASVPTRGEVWIDTRTFVLEKAMWKIDNVSNDVQSISIEFSRVDGVANLPTAPDAAREMPPSIKQALHTISLDALLPKSSE